ncbi:GapS4a family protein [Flavobacterium bizetiae]|uniref:GapS4a family protein n=1 Tax=Flavobacterium bizetiae TaxID=2704140 RepID=UPI0037573698
MGEYSKRIGEVGENVVVDFLNLIGWKNPLRNDDIESIDTDFRKRTNGIDGYFHYINPMVSSTIENVIYSSKYSTDPYPTSQITTQFKDRYLELAKAIESFKKSELKQYTINLHQNIDTHFDRGILFWLNNSGTGENDLISRLSRIELNTGVNHDGIFLVDNKRIEFIYDSICFAQLKYRYHDVDFIYFNNGLNNDDRNPRNGKIMPVQYINSSILPLRASKDNETTIIINSIENFDRDDLMKYMGIAKNIGCNSQGATVISFPDYSETEHLPTVNNIKQIFNDASFTSQLEVVNFNNPILR